jgi:hypothetical protein
MLWDKASVEGITSHREYLKKKKEKDTFVLKIGKLFYLT